MHSILHWAIQWKLSNVDVCLQLLVSADTDEVYSACGVLKSEQ